MKSKTDIFKDFEIFSRALITSKDVDPVYPFVKAYLDKNPDIDKEWFVFIYVMFYSLESAIKITNKWPLPGTFNEHEFWKIRKMGEVTKFGHERRGTARSVDNQIIMINAIKEFLTDIYLHQIGEIESPMMDSNEDFRVAISTLPFHGLWAAFKITELFEKSLGYKRFEIKDLGLDGRDPNSNDGPVAGLRHLFGLDNKYSVKWFPIWNRFGENLAKAWGVEMGAVETCMCKFHKFATGKYYVFHDIHEFLELRHDKILPEKDFNDIMTSAGFPIISWKNKLTGVQKHMKGEYLKEGKIWNTLPGLMSRMPKIDVYQHILDL